MSVPEPPKDWPSKRTSGWGGNGLNHSLWTLMRLLRGDKGIKVRWTGDERKKRRGKAVSKP